MKLTVLLIAFILYLIIFICYKSNHKYVLALYNMKNKHFFSNACLDAVFVKRLYLNMRDSLVQEFIS